MNRNVDQIFGINGSWLAHLMPAANQDYAPILARIIFGIFPIVLYFMLAGYAAYRVMNCDRFRAQDFSAHDAAADRHHGSVSGSDAQLCR